MKTALLFFLFIFAEIGLGEEGKQSAAIIGDIPIGTISWVLAALAFLNGLSELLERIESWLRTYSQKTATKADDKALKWLERITDVLQKLLRFAHMTVDFFAAKGKSKK